MRTFSKVLRAFVTSNPNFLVFLTGFSLFLVSLAQVSPAVAGVSGGLILMAVAVWPFLIARKP